MAAPEQYTNNGQTTLAGTITSGATSLVVATNTTFPTVAGQFRILIDSEIMIVTGGFTGGGVTWTVSRGAEGTTAAAHNNGATVTEVLTAGAIDQVRIETFGAGGQASIPAGQKQGRVYLANDAPLAWYDNGTHWVPIIHNAHGIILAPDNPIVPANFSWVNQGSATIATIGAGSVLLSTPAGTGDQIRAQVKAVPAAPYKAEIGLLPFPGVEGNFHFAGILVRESSTGKLKTWACSKSDLQHAQLTADLWTNPTTYSAAIGTRISYEHGWPAFMRIFDDNTNLNFQISFNRQTWITLATNGRTLNMTADQVGFFVHTAGTIDPNNCYFTHYIEY